MKDARSDFGFITAVEPQVLAAGVTSAAIDLQGFNSALAIVGTGAVAGAGDFGVKLQESDTTNSGDFGDVVAGDLLGSFPVTLEASKTYKVGYKGNKRYIRVVVSKAGGTSIAGSVVVMLGDAANSPVE